MMNNSTFRLDVMKLLVAHSVHTLEAKRTTDNQMEYYMRLNYSRDWIELSETEYKDVCDIAKEEQEVRHFINELRDVGKWQGSYSLDSIQEEMFVSIVKKHRIIESYKKHYKPTYIEGEE